MRKGIEIFRAGKQTSSAGESLDFTEAELDATIAAYDPALHEAPLVVGHPKTDAPAYGWVKGLARDGEVLAAEPHQVDAAFAELVAAGQYKKVSASFYKPDSERNPVPGVYYLRHVGFLGAAPPAVRGLKDASFDEGAEDVVEFEAPAMSLMAERDNASLWRSLRDWILGKFGVEEADSAVPSWYVEQLREEQARRSAETHPESSFAEGDEPAAESGTSSEGTPVAAGEQTAAEPVAEPEAPAAEPSSSTDAEPAAATPEPDAVDRVEAELERRRAELEEREAAFRERESAARRRDVTEFVAGLEADGCRILPRDRAALVELLFAAEGDAAAELEFAEEDGTQVKTATGAWLRDFLKRLPRQVDFAEFAAAGRDPDTSDPVALADAARKYQAEQEAAGRHVRISDAVRHVSGGRR